MSRDSDAHRDAATSQTSTTHPLYSANLIRLIGRFLIGQKPNDQLKIIEAAMRPRSSFPEDVYGLYVPEDIKNLITFIKFIQTNKNIFCALTDPDLNGIYFTNLPRNISAQLNLLSRFFLNPDGIADVLVFGTCAIPGDLVQKSVFLSDLRWHDSSTWDADIDINPPLHFVRFPEHYNLKRLLETFSLMRDVGSIAAMLLISALLILPILYSGRHEIISFAYSKWYGNSSVEISGINDFAEPLIKRTQEMSGEDSIAYYLVTAIIGVTILSLGISSLYDLYKQMCDPNLNTASKRREGNPLLVKKTDTNRDIERHNFFAPQIKQWKASGNNASSSASKTTLGRR